MPEKAKIKVVSKRPGMAAEIVEIDPSYEFIRSYIGGFVEIVRHGHYTGIALVVDEEGKIRDRPENFYFDQLDDVIVGVALFARVSTDEDGPLIKPLHDWEAEAIVKGFHQIHPQSLPFFAIDDENLCDHHECDGSTIGQFYELPGSVDVVRCDRHPSVRCRGCKALLDSTAEPGDVCSFACDDEVEAKEKNNG